MLLGISPSLEINNSLYADDRYKKLHESIIEEDQELKSQDAKDIVLKIKSIISEKNKDAFKDIADEPKEEEDWEKLLEKIQEELTGDNKSNYPLEFQVILNDYEIKIPVSLKDFVKEKKHLWVQNAISALYEFQENIHYVIQDGMIKPVAFDSNGVVQNFTQWVDGLHQFLQIKHHLKLTSETFTTNFLSNIAYFRRYKSNIFGLTGTLGSEKLQKILAETYELDLIKVPKNKHNQSLAKTYKPDSIEVPKNTDNQSLTETYEPDAIIVPKNTNNQYFILPNIIAENQEEWLLAIRDEVLKETKKERGVLVICLSIEDAFAIEAELKKHRKLKCLIKTYTLNDQGQEKQITYLAVQETIIATTLAGRGTNITTSEEMEKSCGMHVCLTFMPESQRIEDQAFGRTSRQGNRGTVRKIINKNRLIWQYQLQSDVSLETQRDDKESERFDNFIHKELKVIEKKDNLFAEFCKLIERVRSDIRKDRPISDKAKSFFVEVEVSVYENTTIAAIEERWAMFLIRFEKGAIAVEIASEEYKKLEEKIWQDYDAKCLIQNPYHYIAIANDLLINRSNFAGALECFERAIKEDKDFSVAAYFGKAWLAVKEQQGNYKQKAIGFFRQAQFLIMQEIAILANIQTLYKSCSTQSDFFCFLALKINLIASYSKSIDAAIDSIKESQRLIDVRQNSSQGFSEEILSLAESQIDYELEISGPEQKTGNAAKLKAGVTGIKNFVSKKIKLTKFTGLASFQSSQQTKIDKLAPSSQDILWLNLNGLHDERMPKLWRDRDLYDVEFNSLTRRSDTGAKDQALKTIDAAYEGEDKLEAGYKEIAILVRSVDFKSIISPFSRQVRNFISRVFESLQKKHLISTNDQYKNLRKTIDKEELTDEEARKILLEIKSIMTKDCEDIFKDMTKEPDTQEEFENLLAKILQELTGSIRVASGKI